MSAQAMAWAWDQNLKYLPKLILLALAENSTSEGVCQPSIETISAWCGASRTAVIRNINQLVEDKFLTKTIRRIGTTNATNIYTLQLKKAADKHNNKTSIGGSGKGLGGVAEKDQGGGGKGLRGGGGDAPIVFSTRRKKTTTDSTSQVPTTDASISKGVSSRNFEYVFPKDLSPKDQLDIGEILKAVNTETGQQILDVLAVNFKDGKVRNATALTRGLVARCEKGDFNPAPGEAVAKARSNPANDMTVSKVIHSTTVPDRTNDEIWAAQAKVMRMTLDEFKAKYVPTADSGDASCH